MIILHENDYWQSKNCILNHANQSQLKFSTCRQKCCLCIYTYVKQLIRDRSFRLNFLCFLAALGGNMQGCVCSHNLAPKLHQHEKGDYFYLPLTMEFPKWFWKVFRSGKRPAKAVNYPAISNQFKYWCCFCPVMDWKPFSCFSPLLQDRPSCSRLDMGLKTVTAPPWFCKSWVGVHESAVECKSPR